MFQRQSISMSLRALFGSLLIAGCASVPPGGYAALPPTADSTQEIEATQASLTQARNEKIPVLAPDSFKKAEKSLELARERRADNAKNEQVLDAVARSRAWLKISQDKANIARAPMQQVLDAREAAVQAQAPTVYPDDFEDLEEEAQELAADIENNDDLEPAKEDGPDLVKDFRELEVKTLEKRHLATAEKALDQAEDEGADDYAPKTLEKTRAQIEAARSTIKKSPREPASYEPSAQQATASAEHLLKITREAKTMNKRSAEDLALASEESRLTQEQLAAQNAAKSAEIASRDAQIANTQKSAEALSQELQDTKLRRAKLDAVRARFSPEEAEIDDRGDAILIRLKGLKFASSKSEIPTSAFPLLSKVQETLREFPTSDIRIEGHTDSVGSPQINKKISQARAEAVEDYLAANEVASKGEMEAVGMGLERPIANNRTREGRAQNRRIDLVVNLNTTPQVSPVRADPTAETPTQPTNEVPAQAR